MIDHLRSHPTTSRIIEFGSLGSADSLGCFGWMSAFGEGRGERDGWDIPKLADVKVGSASVGSGSG
jgi:hypothetical protein